jgi:hypothetical protein
MEDIFKYFQRIGIAISVLFNVILGGYSNQTFSARNYGWKREGKPNLVWLIDVIFWFDPDHCLQSWTYWVVRKEHITCSSYTDMNFADGAEKLNL